MNAEKKPRKRLAKLVSDLKGKIKGKRATPDVAAETVTLAITAAASDVETISRRAVIAGYITDDHTKQAISGAVVELAGQNLQTVTRGDGFFYFLHPPVPAPTEQEPKIQYTLKVTVPHLNIYYGETTVENIEVKNDDKGRPVFDTDANIGLPSTRLAGQVKRSDDQPIDKAKVELLGSNIQTLTGPDGKYALFGLQKGEPTVQASAAGYNPAEQKVKLTAGQEVTVNFVLVKST